MSETKFNAFAAARRECADSLLYDAGKLLTLNKLEELLPSFVAGRFRFIAISENYLSMFPFAAESFDPDSMHADVYKLFKFLVKKRVDNGNIGLSPDAPSRIINKNSGLITYHFTLHGLPMDPLSVEISGLPVGSKCEVIKHVKGTRVVEDVEYELVCEEEAL